MPLSGVLLLECGSYLWAYVGWRQTDEYERHVRRRHVALDQMLISGEWTGDREHSALVEERAKLAKWLSGDTTEPRIVYRSSVAPGMFS